MTSLPMEVPETPEGSSAPDPTIPGELWVVIKRIPTYARLVANMARDSRVPRSAKAFLVAGGAYMVSPVDLVPGLIPVAGQLDDLYVVLLGLQQAVKRCPTEVVDEHFAAVGLERSVIEDDLAAIRSFVRRGIGWAVQHGGRAAAAISRQVGTLVSRARDRKESPL